MASFKLYHFFYLTLLLFFTSKLTQILCQSMVKSTGSPFTLPVSNPCSPAYFLWVLGWVTHYLCLFPPFYNGIITISRHVVSFRWFKTRKGLGKCLSHSKHSRNVSYYYHKIDYYYFQKFFVGTFNRKYLLMFLANPPSFVLVTMHLFALGNCYSKWFC